MQESQLLNVSVLKNLNDTAVVNVSRKIKQQILQNNYWATADLIIKMLYTEPLTDIYNTWIKIKRKIDW